MQPTEFCLVVSLAILVASIWTVDAEGHEAPAGWSYDISCCSRRDCREVPTDWITATPEGWRVPTGEIVPYAKAKQSKDDAFHWCTYGGSDTGKTICLYVPPQAF